jgi:hypothetical protein
MTMKRLDRLWLSFTKNGRALKRGIGDGDITVTVDHAPSTPNPDQPDPVTIVTVNKRGATTQQWTPRKRRAHRRIELGLLWVAVGFGVAALWNPDLIGLSVIFLAIAYAHVRFGIGLGTPFVDITTMGPDVNIERRSDG